MNSSLPFSFIGKMILFIDKHSKVSPVSIWHKNNIVHKELVWIHLMLLLFVPLPWLQLLLNDG